MANIGNGYDSLLLQNSSFAKGTGIRYVLVNSSAPTEGPPNFQEIQVPEKSPLTSHLHPHITESSQWKNPECPKLSLTLESTDPGRAPDLSLSPLITASFQLLLN
jgi:hypothetical protein